MPGAPLPPRAGQPPGQPGTPPPPRPPGTPRPFDAGPGGHWRPPGEGGPPTEPSPWAPAASAPAGPPGPPGSPAAGGPATPPAGIPGLPGDPASVPPPGGGRKRRRLVIAGVLIAVLAIVAVAAVLLRSPDDAERNGGGDIVSGGDMSALSFREGDCWNDPPLDQEVESVAAVPCTEAHDAEVYAVFDLAFDEFPGDEEIGAAAEAGCIERFAEFAGIDYASSALEVVYLNPTQESWDTEDDRSAVCSVSDPAAPTTGSLRGAAR